MTYMNPTATTSPTVSRDGRVTYRGSLLGYVLSEDVAGWAVRYGGRIVARRKNTRRDAVAHLVKAAHLDIARIDARHAR